MRFRHDSGYKDNVYTRFPHLSHKNLHYLCAISARMADNNALDTYIYYEKKSRDHLYSRRLET